MPWTGGYGQAMATNIFLYLHEALNFFNALIFGWQGLSHFMNGILLMTFWDKTLLQFNALADICVIAFAHLIDFCLKFVQYFIDRWKASRLKFIPTQHATRQYTQVEWPIIREHHNDGLVQDCGISSSLALKISLSCTKLRFIYTQHATR